MAKSNVILDFLFRCSLCGEILRYRSLSPIIILIIHSWKTYRRIGFGKSWVFSLRFMFVFDMVIPKNMAMKKLKRESLFCESAGLTIVAAFFSSRRITNTAFLFNPIFVQGHKSEWHWIRRSGGAARAAAELLINYSDACQKEMTARWKVVTHRGHSPKEIPWWPFH